MISPFPAYFFLDGSLRRHITGGAQTPAIGSFSPTAGRVGDQVFIQGVGFTGATAVRFNGENAPFSPINDTSINVTVPPGATTGPISIVTPNGTAVSSTVFSVQ